MVIMNLTYLIHTLYNAYEVALGIENNQKSIIMRERGGDSIGSTDTPNILNCDEYGLFWISWYYSTRLIKVGYGGRLGDNSFLSAPMTGDFFKVNSVSVSIGGTSGTGGDWEFRQTKGWYILACVFRCNQ